MTNEPIYTSRREFLAGSLSVLSAAATMPLFLGNTVRALAQDSQPARKSDSHRILVVVQLAGGNDGLNTVVPCGMDGYYKARPQLAVAKKDVLALEKGVGLNPACVPLKELFDDGKLAIVQGVGYPNPNRSHFTSMDIWHTADPRLRNHGGWLGRFFDAQCKGDDPAPDPVNGIALMKESPLALQGEKFMPMSFENIDALRWQRGRRDKSAEETFRQLNNIHGDIPKQEHEIAEFLQRAALNAQVGADDILKAAGASGGRRFAGGGDLDRSLSLVARMIAADLPTRIYYVSMGGFDTHTGQEGRHRRLLNEFSKSMKDFIDTLAEQKLLDRVLVVTFSEFGRRVQENASGGTDHGEAAPMFLFGSKLRAGIHEEHPDLSKLHRGDLEFGCDFRRVYAAVLQNWLGTRPEKIVGAGFPPLRLIKT